MKRIWVRRELDIKSKILFGVTAVILLLAVWSILSTIRFPYRKIDSDKFESNILSSLRSEDDKNSMLFYYEKSGSYFVVKKKLTTADKMKIWEILTTAGYAPGETLPNPIVSPNILPHPMDVIKAFPSLIKGTSSSGFEWEKSLFFAIWISLRREITAFFAVLLFALVIGIFMSTSNYVRAFYMPYLVIGTFIPIAALIPLTQAFFGIGEMQKIIFLGLGMFFVLLGLVMKEMDEVDNIYLETAYTLGFSQMETIFLVNFPIALPRIWKHFAAVFGLGWGYIIFAEMINVGGSDFINGIGWLFIARKRRLQIPDMYAIFFVIIFFAFLFSYIFKALGWLFFKSERKTR